MSKTGKKRKHSAKMARKRAAKATRRAQYAQLAGTSKRRKRQGQKQKSTGLKGAHVMLDCGNVGCKRCYPRPSRMIVA